MKTIYWNQQRDKKMTNNSNNANDRGYKEAANDSHRMLCQPQGDLLLGRDSFSLWK